MEKKNIIPGPYIIVDQSLYSKATGECICQTYMHSNHNKEFVGEAFNVFHESGLTPRELLEQRDEAIALLKKIVEERNPKAIHYESFLIVQAQGLIARVDAITKSETK